MVRGGASIQQLNRVRWRGAAVLVASVLLGWSGAARANCYSFTNVSRSARYLTFSANRSLPALPASLKLEPGARYPSDGHPFCVDDAEIRIEVYLGAGGSIDGWDGGAVIGAGSLEGFMMGNDSVAAPTGDYKIN